VSENQPLVAGRYALGRVIGTGGVATVYSAEDTTLDRKVALKIVNPELAANSAFDAALLNEAQSASSLNHPNIVNVLDAGEDRYLDETGTEHKRSFIVMERVDGLELNRLTSRGPLKATEAVRVAGELLAALEYAHNAGIIHRDIKPSNIMINRQGQVKILDFGIARAVSDTFDDIDQTTSILGTAAYFSPEQARGEKVDARTDIYTVGVVLYEMLTGRPPFSGDTAVAVAHQHLHAQPVAPSTLNPKVSPELDAVVLHALSKDRNTRYSTAAAFADDLRQVEAGGSPRATLVEPAAVVAATLASTEVSVEEVPPKKSLYTPLVIPEDKPTEQDEFDDVDPDLPPEFASVFGAGIATTASIATATTQQKRRRALNATGLIASIFVVVAILGVLISMTKGNELFGTSRVIPSVDNLSYNQAVGQLSRSGLVAEEVQESSDDVVEGRVIRTEPPTGVKVENGSTVRVYVSSGKPKQAVPPVTGMTVESATAAIKAAGFVVGTITQANSATIKLDMVISTDPAQGTTLAAESTVNLIVSNGQFDMPDLRGKSVKDASAELSKLLISPTVKADPSCPKTAEPVVATQSVKPGVTKQGTPVTLTYCAG
jgi:serine/threonine-protein kinase